MTVTKTFYERSYTDLGFAAQRRYPNEELLRFMGGNFFGISHAQRRDMKILELGCGSGANLWMVAREGFQAYGIDLSEESLKLCKMMLDSWGVAAELVSGDMSALHYKPAMFDAVLDVFSAYCLDEAGFQKCMDEVARVLKSGGRYFSYAPAKNSDAFKNYAPAYKLDDSTLNGILRPTSPYSGQTYPFRFISREEYAAALQVRGFVITSNESVGRTYRGGNEYFEFVSIAAQKT